MVAEIGKINRWWQKNYWSVIILALFLIFCFGLVRTSFNAPWERDEGEYAYSAWLLQRGQTPYLDSFLQKPPLIIYTYYLAEWLRPLALWPPRLLADLFTLATAMLLALIARQLYGRLAGWLALWISPLLLFSPYFTALSANTEKFMLLPLVGLIALLVFKQGRESRGTWLAAGAIVAAAVLYKPIALPPAGLLVLAWLGLNWRTAKSWRSLISAAGLILAGGLVTTAIVVGYFLWRGAGLALWQQAVVYNVGYIAGLKKYFPAQFWHYLSTAGFNWWPIFLLILVTAGGWSRKFSGLWWSLLIISLLTVSGSPLGHYYLLLAPFIILISAAATASLLAWAQIREPIWEKVALAGLIIFISLVAGCSSGEQFILQPNELSAWIYGTDEPFIESRLLAEQIRARTGSSDRIFIIGSEPQLYYFSQRLAVSKFDITYPLMIDTPWRVQFQEQAIAALQKTKPAAIVLSRYADSGAGDSDSSSLYLDYLSTELQNNYHLVGGTVLDSSAPAGPVASWVGPTQASHSQLLLFIKNY
jgi:hypothetical protein